MMEGAAVRMSQPWLLFLNFGDSDVALFSSYHDVWQETLSSFAYRLRAFRLDTLNLQVLWWKLDRLSYVLLTQHGTGLKGAHRAMTFVDIVGGLFATLHNTSLKLIGPSASNGHRSSLPFSIWMCLLAMNSTCKLNAFRFSTRNKAIRVGFLFDGLCVF